MLSTWEDGLCGDLQGRRQPVMFNISLGKKWDKVGKLSNLGGGEGGGILPNLMNAKLTSVLPLQAH